MLDSLPVVDGEHSGGIAGRDSHLDAEPWLAVESLQRCVLIRAFGDVEFPPNDLFLVGDASNSGWNSAVSADTLWIIADVQTRCREAQSARGSSLEVILVAPEADYLSDFSYIERLAGTSLDPCDLTVAAWRWNIREKRLLVILILQYCPECAFSPSQPQTQAPSLFR